MGKSKSKKKNSHFDKRGLLVAVLITALIIFIAHGGFGALAKVLLKIKSESSAAASFNFLYF